MTSRAPHDLALLSQIDQAITMVVERMSGIPHGSELDATTSDAVLWRLNVISQCTERLSEDIRHAHPEVEWPGLGMLSQVASGNLGGLTRDEVWRVTDTALPRLHTAVKQELGNGEATPVAPGPRNQIRVLLADDDPDIRRILDLLLSHAGFDVTEAADGQEALDLAISMKPDALIADVQMPHIDGVALVEQLRRTPGLERTPVLLFTGKPPTAAITSVLGLDRVRYMSKGDPKRVIAALDEMLATERTAGA